MVEYMDTENSKQQTLFSETIVQKIKPKPIIPARSAINWYFGNYLMSHENALRDINEEKFLEDTHKLVDKLHVEFKDQKFTHKQFLDLMKERGIHAKYYLYQKPKPNDCPWCRIFGIH